MAARVDLVWLGSATEPPEWTLGTTLRSAAEPRALHDVIGRGARDSTAGAWLFWDSSLTAPAPTTVLAALDRPGDIWHAGLTLGLAGAPGIIDFISPTWTFNRDPRPDIEATSWRLSLRACLVRTAVLRWSRPSASFDSLDGSALDWGHRCISYGALPRHLPSLLRAPVVTPHPSLTLADELRFARARFGTRWALWATLRAAISGYARMEDLADAWLTTVNDPAPPAPSPYVQPSAERRAPSPAVRLPVTVVIPTIDRYQYLRTILAQLRIQTVPPAQLIVVDQTPVGRRQTGLASEFGDLPLTVIDLEKAGQCTSRNIALARATGAAILFVDDDDEIGPDLIGRHLAHLLASGADVSSGVAHEPSSGALPEAFLRSRASDVFPTNNSLVRRSILLESGLFDLAFDHGARADGDLGMRIYLAGAIMRLDAEISVLHHHAARGGLRTHGARRSTYGSSRNRILERNLPEVTELYRTMRYFSARQLRESMIQAAAGTMSVRGGSTRRVMKAAVALLLMPATLAQLSIRRAAAERMLRSYPRIPELAATAR